MRKVSASATRTGDVQSRHAPSECSDSVGDSSTLQPPLKNWNIPTHHHVTAELPGQRSMSRVMRLEGSYGAVHRSISSSDARQFNCGTSPTRTPLRMPVLRSPEELSFVDDDSRSQSGRALSPSRRIGPAVTFSNVSHNRPVPTSDSHPTSQANYHTHDTVPLPSNYYGQPNRRTIPDSHAGKVTVRSVSANRYRSLERQALQQGEGERQRQLEELKMPQVAQAERTAYSNHLTHSIAGSKQVQRPPGKFPQSGEEDHMARCPSFSMVTQTQPSEMPYIQLTTNRSASHPNRHAVAKDDKQYFYDLERRNTPPAQHWPENHAQYQPSKPDPDEASLRRQDSQSLERRSDKQVQTPRQNPHPTSGRVTPQSALRSRLARRVPVPSATQGVGLPPIHFSDRYEDEQFLLGSRETCGAPQCRTSVTCASSGAPSSFSRAGSLECSGRIKATPMHGGRGSITCENPNLVNQPKPDLPRTYTPPGEKAHHGPVEPAFEFTRGVSHVELLPPVLPQVPVGLPLSPDIQEILEDPQPPERSIVMQKGRGSANPAPHLDLSNRFRSTAGIKIPSPPTNPILPLSKSTAVANESALMATHVATPLRGSVSQIASLTQRQSGAARPWQTEKTDPSTRGERSQSRGHHAKASEGVSCWDGNDHENVSLAIPTSRGLFSGDPSAHSGPRAGGSSHHHPPRKHADGSLTDGWASQSSALKYFDSVCGIPSVDHGGGKSSERLEMDFTTSEDGPIHVNYTLQHNAKPRMSVSILSVSSNLPPVLCRNRRSDDSLPSLVTSGSASKFRPLDRIPYVPRCQALSASSRQPSQTETDGGRFIVWTSGDGASRRVSRDRSRPSIGHRDRLLFSQQRQFKVKNIRKAHTPAAALFPRRDWPPAAAVPRHRLRRRRPALEKKIDCGGGRRQRNCRDYWPETADYRLWAKRPPQLNVADLLKEEYAEILSRHGYWGEKGR